MILDCSAPDWKTCIRRRIFVDGEEIKSVWYVDTDACVVKTYDVLDRCDVAITVLGYAGVIDASWDAPPDGVFSKTLHGAITIETIMESPE